MKASCIIPTFGRTEQVLQETLESLFNLKDEFFDNCLEIILIDQNARPLCLQQWIENLPLPVKFRPEYFRMTPWEVDPSKTAASQMNSRPDNNRVQIFHFYGLQPSVTKAKNFGIRMSRGEILLFFDDDVTLFTGCISLHLSKQMQFPRMGMLGGRETVVPKGRERSPFRTFLANCGEKVVKFAHKFNHDPIGMNKELGYKAHGRYVGRILPNSFFFCHYDLPGEQLVIVDTVRGCNASLKRSVFNEVTGFDEKFQGTALREESDLCLRIQKAGHTNYYLGDARVNHRRQAGGCNNLSKSYQVLFSKLECELYFQSKHFKNVSPLFFFLRLLPLAIESLVWTWGMSMVFLAQFTFQFFRLRRLETSEVTG